MDQAEMLKTFNAGIGMVVVVDPASEVDVTSALEAQGQGVTRIGTVEAGQGGVHYSGALL